MKDGMPLQKEEDNSLILGENYYVYIREEC